DSARKIAAMSTPADGPSYAAGSSWNGRTSTGALQATVARAASASASSRSAAWMTQNPPSCSFVSANGPSVVMTSPPSATLTTVAVLAGCSPPAKTHFPAALSSSLKTSTSLKACSISSGEAYGSVPSTIHTLIRYCVIGITPFPTGTVPAFHPSYERAALESTAEGEFF